MKVPLFLHVFLLLLTFVATIGHAFEGNCEFVYKVPITISSPISGMYDVLIIMDTSTATSEDAQPSTLGKKLDSECRNIRFRVSETDTWLDFWVLSECGNANTHIVLQDVPLIIGTINIDAFYMCINPETGESDPNPSSSSSQGSKISWTGHFYFPHAGNSCPAGWTDILYGTTTSVLIKGDNSGTPQSGSPTPGNFKSRQHAAINTYVEILLDASDTMACDSDGGMPGLDPIAEAAHKHYTNADLQPISFSPVAKPSYRPPCVWMPLCQSEESILSIVPNLVVPLAYVTFPVANAGNPTLPPSTSRFGVLDGKFILSSTAGLYDPISLTCGSDNHTHDIVGTHYTSPVVSGDTHAVGDLGTVSVVEFLHEHEAQYSTSAVSNLPTYVETVFAKLGASAGTDFQIASNEILLFVDEIPPAGFVESVSGYNDGIYLRGGVTSSDPATPVSPNSGDIHDLLIEMETCCSDGGNIDRPNSGEVCSTPTHGHQPPVSLGQIPAGNFDQDSADYVPLRMVQMNESTARIRPMSSDIVIGSEMKILEIYDCFGIFWMSSSVCGGSGGNCSAQNRCENGFVGTGGNGFDPTAAIVGSVVGSIVIIAIVIVVVVVVGVFVMLKLQSAKNRDYNLPEVQLNAEDEAKMAKFVLNEQLFHIAFEDVSLKKILGQGGSNSVIYAAEWEGKSVAVKVYSTLMLGTNTHSFEEFERELAVMSSMRHPNIIGFFGACVKPPRVCIVMELAINGDMDHFLRKRVAKGDPVSLFHRMRLLREIADGLHYMHCRNILHRDLKLENVLIDLNETAKLIDFGLSKVVADMKSGNLTRRLGTPTFMAPEMVLGMDYNETVDVYSYGVVCFCILEVTNNPYGVGTDVMHRARRASTDPSYRPTFADEAVAQKMYPSWLVAIMRECWAHVPDDRPSFEQIRKVFMENAGDQKVDDSLKTQPLVQLADKGDESKGGEEGDEEGTTVVEEEKEVFSSKDE